MQLIVALTNKSIGAICGRLFTVCLICSSGMINADEKSELKKLYKYSLEELMQVEVYVASGNSQKQSLAPSSVTVFSRQEIKNMGITSIEQLLNFVPGFQSSRESVAGDGYMIAARGQSNTQLTESILFLLDGKRMNTELAGGAMEFNHFITTANVKRIEILRGANSALYGSSAYSGVVNIITVSDLNEAQVIIGDLGQQELNLNYSTTLSDTNISLFARYFSDKGDNYDNAYYQSLNPNFEVINDAREGREIYLKFNYDHQFQINFHHVNVEELGFFSFPPGSAYPDDSASQQENSVYAKYEQKTDEKFQFGILGAYSDYQRIQNLTVRNTTGFYDQRVEAINREWMIGLESNFTSFNNHIFSAGAEWRRVIEAPVLQFDNEADPSGDIVFSHNRQNELDKRQILGLYLQDQYNINKNLQLTAGVRYDKYSDFGEELSPRASLVYDSNYGSTFKLMYSEAYRAPNLRQLGSSVVGNMDIRAEYVQSTELAWIHQFKKSMFSLTAFHANYENKITTIPRPPTSPPGGPRIFSNTDDVSAKGVEIEFNTTLSKGLTLRTALTLQDTEEDPHFVAEKTFSLIANYEHEDININLNGFYHGEMEQIGSLPNTGNTKVILDDYFILNGAVSYTFDSNLRFFLRIHNMLDNDYQSATRILAAYEGMPNRGRTTSIGLELPF